MATTFGGMYYLGRNGSNAARDAMYASGFTGAGYLMYNYLLAPPITTLQANPPITMPNSSVYNGPNATNNGPGLTSGSEFYH